MNQDELSKQLNNLSDLAQGLSSQLSELSQQALTVGADSQAGRVTLDTMQLVQQELGANLSLGASNVSFGLPDRLTVNQAFLALAIQAGATCSITDPTNPVIRQAILAGDLLMGNDPYAGTWIAQYRERQKALPKP